MEKKLDTGPEYYYFVDLLRVVSCCLVVWHHTLGYFNDVAVPFAIFYLDNVKIFTATVPIFIVCSSFVYADNIERKYLNYSKYIVGRFKRILVPYFSISLTTVILKELLYRYNILENVGQLQSGGMNDLLVDIFFAGAADHYYFLIIVFVYLAIYPLIVVKIKSEWYSLFLFMGYFFAYELFDFYFFEDLNLMEDKGISLFLYILWGFKYFLFGFLLYKFNSKLWKSFVDYGHLIGIVMMLLYGLLVNKYPSLFRYLVYVLILSYVSLSVKASLRPVKIIEKLSSMTYGVYIFHQPYFIKLFVVLTGFSILIIPPNLRVVVIWIFSLFSTCIFIYIAQKYSTFRKLFLGT